MFIGVEVQRCSLGFRSGDCGGKSMVGLQVVVAKLVSEERSGTSPPSGCCGFGAGVQLQRRQSNPSLEYSHKHVSLLF